MMIIIAHLMTLSRIKKIQLLKTVDCLMILSCSQVIGRLYSSLLWKCLTALTGKATGDEG